MFNHFALPARLRFARGYRHPQATAGLLTLALHGALLWWLIARPAVAPLIPAAQPMVMLAVAKQAEALPDSQKLATGIRQVQALQSQSAPPPQAAPKLAQVEQGTIHQRPPAEHASQAPADKPRVAPKKPAEKSPPSQASRAAPAPDTTAPPAMVGKTVAAPRNQVAPQPNRNASAWSGALLAHLSRYKRYPALALRQKRQGVAQISITLDRQGRVLAVALLKSSGVASLDNEATALPKRASPVPAPPAEMAAGQAEFSISMPLRFDLREVRG